VSEIVLAAPWDLYGFVLGIVLGLYNGFPRLNQLRFIERDPILTGILKVTKRRCNPPFGDS
jgi:hypothetical protein